jgi:hypothetical protein
VAENELEAEAEADWVSGDQSEKLFGSELEDEFEEVTRNELADELEVRHGILYAEK